MNKPSSIWALAFPIILSNITIPLLGAVDTAVMGHMETAAYLAAVAIGALIFDYIYWGFGFLRLSTTGLCAQALGAEEDQEVLGVIGRAFLIALIGAGFLWGVQGWIFQIAAYLLETAPDVETFAKTYFDIRIWSAPAALLNYVLMGSLLAFKDTKSVLIQQVSINLVNIVLDLFFVFQLGYGVEGVAAATLIAQYIGLGIGLWFLRGKLQTLKAGFKRAALLDWPKIKEVTQMNFDLFIRTICLLSAFAWFTALGAKMGTVILAANAILLQFQQFTSYALDGFAHAIEVLSAHAKGKKDKVAFEEAFKSSTLFALVFALGFSFVYAFWGPELIALFSDLPEVVRTAQMFVIWMVAMPVVSVWSFQFDGLYFGLTQTRILRNMMILSLIGFVIASHFLQGYWGNDGLWAAFTFFMGLRAITLGSMFPFVKKKAFG